MSSIRRSTRRNKAVASVLEPIDQHQLASEPEPTNPCQLETTSLSFLSLPAEIRLIIYRWLFTQLTVFLHRKKHCYSKVKGKDKVKVKVFEPHRFFPLKLFLTNREIYNESLPIYFSEAVFTFERASCHKGRCDGSWFSKPDLTYHQSPHFKSIQRVECTDKDVRQYFTVTKKRRTKQKNLSEITLLVDFDRWLHLVGYPHESTGKLWRDYFTVGGDSVGDDCYTTYLLRWFRGSPTKVIMQCDCYENPEWSIWRENTEPLPYLPHQRYQQIVFEDGKDIVVWGIDLERHGVCEATIRDLFRVPANRTVRFEGTPVEGIYPE